MAELSDVSKAQIDSMRALLSGDAQQALVHARHALELEPDNPAAHSLMAEALVDLGERADAILEMEKALRLAPMDPVVLGVAIRVYRDALALDAAFDVADRATRAQPEDPELWRLRAELQLWYGSVLEALESARRAIELSPLKWDPRAFSTAAYAHGLLGEWDKAKQYFIVAGPPERSWGAITRRRQVLDLRLRRWALKIVLRLRKRISAMGPPPDRS